MRSEQVTGEADRIAATARAITAILEGPGWAPLAISDVASVLRCSAREVE